MIRSNKVRKNKSSNIFPRVLPKGTQPKEEKRRSEKKEKTNDWRCLKRGPYGMVWLHADRSRPVQSSRLEIYYTSYVLPTTKSLKRQLVITRSRVRKKKRGKHLRHKTCVYGKAWQIATSWNSLPKISTLPSTASTAS